MNAHRVINGLRDIGRLHGFVRRISAEPIARTVRLSAANPAADQEIGQAVRPVIAAGSFHAAGARVTDLGFAALCAFSAPHSAPLWLPTPWFPDDFGSGSIPAAFTFRP